MLAPIRSRRRGIRLLATLLMLAFAAPGLAACRLTDQPLIALLLPDEGAARWTDRDKVVFEREVADRCPGCDVRVYIANADPTLQSTQLGQALDAGADVIVLAAVSQVAGEQLLKQAGSTPVIAYDRFIAGADYYVSFDNAAVGRLQAESLVKATGSGARILVVNGGVNDPNAVQLKRAATQVFSTARMRVLASDDPDDWHADTAQKWVTDQLARLGDAAIDGVYAANDEQAEGVVAAFRAAHRKLVPVTGQDGELAALQRIIAGEQSMTVYKSVADEAARAATIAVELVAGNAVEGAKTVGGVPSYLYDPVAVTVANLTDTVVRDGFLTIDQLCTPALLAACVRQGIA